MNIIGKYRIGKLEKGRSKIGETKKPDKGKYNPSPILAFTEI